MVHDSSARRPTRRELIRTLALLLPGLALVPGCSRIRTARGNRVAKSRPVNITTRDAYQVGLASWYGADFAGRPTANGEIYDPEQMTAAHRHLPFGTQVRVTDLETGDRITVRINDRGPFKRGRVIDLSRAAARRLDMLSRGLARVRIDVLAWPRRSNDRRRVR